MKRSNEAMVGVVILASLILVVFGTLWLQGVTLRADEREVTAVFNRVGLIKAGNAVKLRGVQIGRVRDIRVAEDGNLVQVTMRVREEISLPDEAVAIVAPESLFGDWQLEIASRDHFPEHRYAQPTDPNHLPGYSIPDISQLTATADRISADIEVLTERVGIAFSEETARNIASLIENVENVTQRLSDLISQQADAFTGVTDEIQAVAEDVGYAAAGARESFDRINETLAREELSRALEDMTEITANLKELTRQLEGAPDDIRGMAAQADSTFARASAIMAGLEAGEGTLGRLLEDPTMAQEMEGTLQELQLLLVDIRENPRRYLRLSIF